MVVEVLSPSDKVIPWHCKIEEYRQHTRLVYLLLVASERPQATLIARDSGSWTPLNFDGAEASIDLPAVSCRLAMADVYSGINLDDPADAAPDA